MNKKLEGVLFLIPFNLQLLKIQAVFFSTFHSMINKGVKFKKINK